MLAVFGHEEAVAEGEVHDVAYINWLLMVRAGLCGLEFFTPETRAWRQARPLPPSNTTAPNTAAPNTTALNTAGPLPQRPPTPPTPSHRAPPLLSLAARRTCARGT